MKIIIVYDNEIFVEGSGLISDWGFSCLIETENENILFDTGTKGKLLLSNMKILNINPKKINKIIISHEHKDHNGGLKYLIPYLTNFEIYHLSNKSPNKKMKTFFPSKPEKISDKVWTTGLIKGVIDEQSLILKGDRGWYILTGCSHPGIEKILKVSKEIGNIVGIIGGFHGFNEFNLLEDLEFICPCHCTAHKEDIKRIFPNKFVKCGVGKVINLDEKI